jgi:hypothetical protein
MTGNFLLIAEQAGFTVDDGMVFCSDGFMRVHENLRIFAMLIEKAEREVCAKICDEQAARHGFYGASALDSADEIRMRSTR